MHDSCMKKVSFSDLGGPRLTLIPGYTRGQHHNSVKADPGTSNYVQGAWADVLISNSSAQKTRVNKPSLTKKRRRLLHISCTIEDGQGCIMWIYLRVWSKEVKKARFPGSTQASRQLRAFSSARPVGCGETRDPMPRPSTQSSHIGERRCWTCMDLDHLGLSPLALAST